MLQPRQAFFAPTAIPQSLPLEWRTPSSLPLEGFAVLNDTPVACQIRGPTDPQGDRWHGEAVTDEGPFVSCPARRRRPHTTAASAATYPLRCSAPQWARFDNRQKRPAHPPLPSHRTSGSGARGTSNPRTDNDPRRANSARSAPPNLHLPAPRQGILKP